jgi:hypothetical protein
MILNSLLSTINQQLTSLMSDFNLGMWDYPCIGDMDNASRGMRLTCLG